MTIADDIYTTLTGDAGVSALVSTRVYPMDMPQNATLPALTYTRVSETPLVNLDGENATRNSRYQVDCFASTYTGAQALAEAVKAAMVTNSLFGVVRENQNDLYSAEPDRFRVQMDFSIWY